MEKRAFAVTTKKKIKEVVFLKIDRDTDFSMLESMLTLVWFLVILKGLYGLVVIIRVNMTSYSLIKNVCVYDIVFIWK